MALLLPILVPFFLGIVNIITLRYTAFQRKLSVVGGIALLISSVLLLLQVKETGILSYSLAGWLPPFGISIVADLIAAIMVVISALIYLASTIFSLSTIDNEREKHGYYIFTNLLMMGINGSFLTGDIFNLYVFFEIMLMSSFVLLALGNEKAQLEGSIKYVTLNLISSAIFLAATGLLYGLVGTLNMADIAVKLREVDNQALINSIAMLYLIAFGIKSAVFPLFFWLPASYHTPPAVVSALFAGLLTKVGVYAILRVFTLIFISNTLYTHTIILVISGFTMFVGVLGAAAQNEFRRILSFHIISQIGYMIMGIGLFTPLAITGTVFYLIHHIIVKTNLFFISGLTNRIGGCYSLKKLGGFYKALPFISLLFLIPALSLAGIPPLSGFWSKLFIIKAGLDTEQYFLVTVSLVTSLLTLYSMTKIWNEVFWKPIVPQAQNTETDDYQLKKVFSSLPFKEKVSLLLPIILLASITVTIGLFIQPFYELAAEASNQIMNPDFYINSVLKR